MSKLDDYARAVERLKRERTREASEDAETAHLEALRYLLLLPRWRDSLGFKWGRFVRLTGEHERIGNGLWHDHPEYMNGGAELFKIYPPDYPDAKHEGSKT